MTDRHTRRRPFPLAAFAGLAAVGAAAATVAAVSHSYAVCAVGLFVLGGAAFGAYRAARAADARTDRLVLQRLQQQPDLSQDTLANDLGLHQAAARLSLHRLSQSGSLPVAEGPADSGN
ncbi:hypothetical protein [Kitasatospora griseola]|uniref:hypothetical protein n=1 Tax=Kitasatospora griseola TaxID=2064 RepID=UPI0037F21869